MYCRLLSRVVGLYSARRALGQWAAEGPKEERRKVSDEEVWRRMRLKLFAEEYKFETIQRSFKVWEMCLEKSSGAIGSL